MDEASPQTQERQTGNRRQCFLPESSVDAIRRTKTVRSSLQAAFAAPTNSLLLLLPTKTIHSPCCRRRLTYLASPQIWIILPLLVATGRHRRSESPQQTPRGRTPQPATSSFYSSRCPPRAPTRGTPPRRPSRADPRRSSAPTRAAPPRRPSRAPLASR